MYTFSVLAHYLGMKISYILLIIGPPLDTVELKKNNKKKVPIGCSAGNPGSKRASYTKSPEKAESCRISAAANLV